MFYIKYWFYMKIKLSFHLSHSWPISLHILFRTLDKFTRYSMIGDKWFCLQLSCYNLTRDCNYIPNSDWGHIFTCNINETEVETTGLYMEFPVNLISSLRNLFFVMDLFKIVFEGIYWHWCLLFCVF